MALSAGYSVELSISAPQMSSIRKVHDASAISAVKAQVVSSMWPTILSLCVSQVPMLTCIQLQVR